MDNIANLPLVSVCVVTYNQQDYIGETLDSILEQDYPNYEVIVADDASSDDTLKVVESYRDKFNGNLRIISQQQNKGVVNNTIDCILAANSDYIAICEGDDYWIDSNKLSRQIQALESDSTISMSHTNWADYIQKDGLLKHREESGSDFCENNYGSKSVEELILLKYKGIRLSSLCFRKKHFTKFLDTYPEFLNEKYPTLDIEIFYIMAYSGKFHYDAKATVAYRVLDGTVSNSPDVKKRANYALGVLKIEAFFISKYMLSQECTNQAFRRSLSFLSVYCLEYKDRIMAEKLINLSQRSHYKLRFGQKLCLSGANNSFIRIIANYILTLTSFLRR